MAPALLTVVALAALAMPAPTVPIAEVAVEGRPPVPEALVLRVLGVQPGDVFSRAELRRGVQALVASRQVEDVRVWVEEREDGVRVRVWVQAVSRIGRVEVENLPRRLRREVLGELQLVRGGGLTVSAFEAGLEQARGVLRQAGYPAADLVPWLEFPQGTGEVNVTLEAALGPPRQLGRVETAGLDWTPEQGMAASGLREGQVLSVRRLEEARRRTARTLRRDGFWAAEVEEPRLRGPAAETVVQVFAVPGSPYRLELEGVRMSRALRAEVLPFMLGEEPFNPGYLDGLLHQLRLFFQRDGRLLADLQVSVEEGGDLDADVLRIAVAGDRRTPVVAVRFPGMNGLRPDQVLPRIGARTGRVWTWGAEPVDDETLQADVVSLLATLQEAGFAEAVVEFPRIVPEERGVAVEFPVTEGPPYSVVEIETEGLPPGLAVRQTDLQVGAPWSLERQERARESLLDGLREMGYADAQVRVTRECPEGKCLVRLEVFPGLQVAIDRVVVAGLVRTRRGVVDRIARLRPDDPLSDELLLEAQRHLLGLGLFRRATARVIPGQESGPRRGVVLEVEEGPTRGFSLGVGWNTEDQARMSLGWSELNLFGTGRSLSADARISNREQRFQVSYREPARLGLLGFPTWVSLYRFEERLPAFDFRRRGTWVEFGDRLRRPSRLLLRYDYQIVGSNAPDEIKSDLERDRQDLSIASLTPILEWDTRDDIFSPRRGVLASLELQGAFRFLLADAVFNKATLSLSAHTPWRRGVLAAAIRIGAIEPGGGSKEVVLPVRFFAGGRVSHRAFGTDRLGIPGKTLDKTGAPIGGGGMLLVSGELRFPFWGPVGAVAFLDGGNVWPQWRNVAPGEMRWGAGVGLRVETPVGPVRLEYGWKFDPEILDAATGLREGRSQLFLSFGNPF